MTAETDLLLALKDCELADPALPSWQIVDLVAAEHGVDPNALLDLWLQKQFAVAQARAAIGQSKQ